MENAFCLSKMFKFKKKPAVKASKKYGNNYEGGNVITYITFTALRNTAG